MKKRLMAFLLVFALFSALLPQIVLVSNADNRVVTAIEIPNITILEGTNGGWLNDNGELRYTYEIFGETQYMYYTFFGLNWELISGKATLVYNDGTRETWHKGNGENIYLFCSKMPYEWNAGDIIDVSAVYSDGFDKSQPSCSFTVTISPSPVERVEIEGPTCWVDIDGMEANDYIIVDDDFKEVLFWHYNTVPMNIKIYFTDGSSISFDPSGYLDEEGLADVINQKLGSEYEIDANNDISFHDDQWLNNKWEIGDHTAQFGIFGRMYDYTVHVIDNPVESVSAQNDTFTFVEHTHGELTEPYVDSITGEESDSFWYYNVYEDIILTVKYKDGRTYTGNGYELFDMTGHFTALLDDQFDQPWGIGKHNACLEFAGFKIPFSVTIIPDDDPINKYTDIPKTGYWAVNGIRFALERGLFNGTDETIFEPETTMNRAMLVTVLWRYIGSPKGYSSSFADVKDGKWYSDAVAWASAEGVVNGVGNGKFEPNGTVTREQMATILFRFAEYSKISNSSRTDFSSYPDAGNVDSWAKNAMQWAVAENLITGSRENGKTYILPLNGATRAQVATILMRFITNLVEK